MLNKIKKITAIIDEVWFGVTTSVMVLLTVWSVIMRYIVHNPIMWAEEVQMILMVWCVFFGGSIAFRERGHIAVDVLFDTFPRKLQMVLNAVIWIAITASVAWIGKLQVERALQMLVSNQTTTILNFPRYIVYSGTSVACLLMLINHFICGIEDVKKFKGGAE